MRNKYFRFDAILSAVLPIIVVVFLALGAITMLRGGKVSTVFSSINYGLDGGGGGVPIAAPQAGVPPIAAPAGAADVATRPTPAAVAAPVAGYATAVSASQQQSSPLKAGEVDDNADFAAYLAYLDSYRGAPAHSVDVRERYLLTVINDQQQPILDARVRL